MPPPSLPPPRPAVAALATDVLRAAGLVATATGIGILGRPVLSDADVVMGYLLGVWLASFRWGRRTAVLASALGVGAFNFFFVPPFHTFAVAELRNLLTFAVLFAVGLVGSTLAERLRRQEAEAIAREQRTAALLALTHATAAATDETEVARAIVDQAATRIATGAVLFAPDDSGRLTAQASAGVQGPNARSAALEAWAADGARTRGESLALLVGPDRPRLAVLVLHAPADGATDLARAYAQQTALALLRVRSAAEAEAAKLRARAEELRSALLSTVSHDLRTPLAAITGAATALLEGDALIPPEPRRQLLASVRDEAARLERLVGNLLEMTRLASGPLPLHREWVPLDEIVGAAFARVDRQLAGHPATAVVAPDLPMVEIDPVLFEQVLVNLLENAARHTPPGTAIQLLARATSEGVEVEVRDAGPGFPPGDPSRLFEPFARGAPSTVPGSGLGLAICRGIVAALGGTIEARRPPGGGAAVVVSLPVRGEPPVVPIDAEESP